MNIVMPLADGLEEIEAVAPLDILRRAGFDVTTVSLGNRSVSGSHDIIIEADSSIDDVYGFNFDAIVCPGGMPGSVNLESDDRVINLIQAIYNNGGYAAAICAAPRVLFKAGILKDKRATCFPGTEKLFDDTVQHSTESVVVDGRVITGKGAGVAHQFGYAIVAHMMGEEKSLELQKKMMFI